MAVRTLYLLVVVALFSTTAGTAMAAPASPVHECTEAGLDEAIAAGSGPHHFSCAGDAWTSVVVSETKLITGELILHGEGRLEVSGASPPSGVRVFEVAPGGDLTLIGVRVTSGQAPWGAGVLNMGTLTMQDSAIIHSRADFLGGGLANLGEAYLYDSVVADNLVYPSANFGNQILGGGGIWNAGRLEARDAAVTNNNVRSGYAVYDGQTWGGGIANVSCEGLSGEDVDHPTPTCLPDSQTPQLLIRNTTISLNVSECEPTYNWLGRSHCNAYGGGIASIGGPVDINGGSVENNLAITYNGLYTSVSSMGGGVALILSRSHFEDAVVTNNAATYAGSAPNQPISLASFGDVASAIAELQLYFLSREDATAFGGGIWNASGRLTLAGTTSITGNVAHGADSTNVVDWYTTAGGLYNVLGRVRDSSSKPWTGSIVDNHMLVPDAYDFAFPSNCFSEPWQIDTYPCVGVADARRPVALDDAADIPANAVSVIAVAENDQIPVWVDFGEEGCDEVEGCWVPKLFPEATRVEPVVAALQILSGPTSGTAEVLSPVDIPSISYSPAPGLSGSDSFTYRLCKRDHFEGLTVGNIHYLPGDYDVCDDAEVVISVEARQPVGDAGGPYVADEGDTVLFDATASNHPDGLDLQYTWTLSPGIPGFDGATGATVSHKFDDDYSGTVSVTVEDPYGLTDTASATVEVANVAPTAVFENDGPVNEGGTFSLKLKDFYDPGGYDTQIWFDYRFDCGDGAGYGGLYPVTFEMCPTTEDGIRTVKGWVEDKDGGFTEYTDTVTINDLAPVAGFAWAPEPSDEGSAVVFTDTSVSAPDAIVGWLWDFGGLGSSTAQNPSFTFADDGMHAVSLTVTDDDGSTSTVSQDVTVANVAPALSNLVGDEVNEGSIAHLSGEISDVGTEDSFTVTVDWQDGYAPDEVAYPAGTTTFELDHQYLDDKPSGTPSDTYQASLTVADDDGGTTTETVAMVINNVAPTLDIYAVADGRPFTPTGVEVDVEAVWGEVGVLDTLTGTIDWGDGTTSDLGDVMWGIAGTHVYDTAGIYDIAVTVTDDDTGATTETVEVDIRDAAEMSDGVADHLVELLNEADQATRRVIQEAIDDLIGNNNGRASNGAEDQFAKGNLVAALGKLSEAAAQLEELDGLDVAGQLVLLALTAQSVAETETAEAREAAGCTDLNATTCSDGERNKVTTVEALLADGRTAIDSGEYVEAIEAFKDAIQRS